MSSGALQRHPNLKFVVAECGAGWLAWLLATLDEQVQKKHMWIRPDLELLPSEFFKRQGYVTFGDDAVGIHNIPFTGADCIMWGSDYPHDEGTFPHSQEVLARMFNGVPEEHAHYYAEGVRRGGTLVTVNADDARADMAYSIMQRHGAVDVNERGAEWRSSGWSRFDPNADPYTTDQIDTFRRSRGTTRS